MIPEEKPEMWEGMVAEKNGKKKPKQNIAISMITFNDWKYT